MYARLRPMRSPTLLPIRMNAAETSASSAIADWMLLTVVPRSCDDRGDRHVHDRRVDDEDEHRHRQQERQESARGRGAFADTRRLGGLEGIGRGVCGHGRDGTACTSRPTIDPARGSAARRTGGSVDPHPVLVVRVVDGGRDEQHLGCVLERAAVGVFAGMTQTSPFLTGRVTPPTVTSPVPSST